MGYAEGAKVRIKSTGEAAEVLFDWREVPGNEDDAFPVELRGYDDGFAAEEVELMR